MLAGIWELEYTLFKWENRKFLLENQMDRPIPLEDFKKKWADEKSWRRCHFSYSC